MEERRKCIVLGAGLSGLVAAFELARRRYEVTIIEAAPFPGGRTSSWRTSTGLHTDTGLHVVANHYVNLLEVLHSVGGKDSILWSDSHKYLRPDRAPMDFHFTRLPAPLHLLFPARAMPLPLAEKRRLCRAVLDLATVCQADLGRFDDITYLDWLKTYELSGDFLLNLADFAADATTFLSAREVSARPVLSWLKYMFRDQHAATMGVWRRPMSEALISPIVQAIQAQGASLLTQRAVVRLEMNGPLVGQVVVRASAETKPCYRAGTEIAVHGIEEHLPCDCVISALPVQTLSSVVDARFAHDAGFEKALELRTVPAISLVLALNGVLDPQVTNVPIVSGSLIRDFIELAPLPHQTNGRSVVQLLLSHSSRHINLDDKQIVSEAFKALNELWPGSRGLQVVDAAIERIGGAMFAATPGTYRLRPAQETRIPNLFLAGDWTRHDLNASMEGAVVSGRLAANGVLRRDGRPLISIRSAPAPLISRLLEKQPRNSLI